jgi:hypothetical protein
MDGREIDCGRGAENAPSPCFTDMPALCSAKSSEGSKSRPEAADRRRHEESEVSKLGMQSPASALPTPHPPRGLRARPG